MKEGDQDDRNEQELLPSERITWQKEGLYIFVSILVLFALHILVTLILLAILGK
ncbi:hypothetical protein MTsPCn5_09130 [Croceitalea sp. MTPC5]|uniref:hypothetical protein n=1 Tax=Croceitalea sp. MTPC5 TaxID=3056565 RepID=UPI002B3EC2DC|nr:hypothetical protein MTsPCn5_09130 [Croceitalea sp. MTPC5]